MISLSQSTKNIKIKHQKPLGHTRLVMIVNLIISRYFTKEGTFEIVGIENELLVPMSDLKSNNSVYMMGLDGIVFF